MGEVWIFTTVLISAMLLSGLVAAVVFIVVYNWLASETNKGKSNETT